MFTIANKKEKRLERLPKRGEIKVHKNKRRPLELLQAQQKLKVKKKTRAVLTDGAPAWIYTNYTKDGPRPK